MDIFSHGLWAGVAYRAANNRRKRQGRQRLSVWWAMFWGVFPDLFAFTIPFGVLAFDLFSGRLTFGDLPGPHLEEPSAAAGLPLMRLASSLYNVSHSVPTFLAVFFLVWLIRRRPVWELGAWLMHIVMDIPTHSYRFFPTPVLWPISGWKFAGFSWATPWFLVPNYLFLAAAYLALVFFRKRHGT